jgi:hypothetical protein
VKEWGSEGVGECRSGGVKEWGSGVEGEMSEGDSGYPIQITHVIHVIQITHCDTHDS